MFLNVVDIDVAYTKHSYLVLKGVSLRVGEGQIVSLIGPNGAGKSTALRAIFGLLKPQKGKVMFRDENITGKRPLEILKKGIAFVFQESSIFPSMSVYENLEMGAFIQDDKNRFEENLQRVYELFPILKEKHKNRAGTLSGGQRRMLEVGRSLILNPTLLLVDEPSVGLSPKLMGMVFEKLIEINRSRKVTIVMVEQNAKQALEISDYAYLLVDGKNRMEGTGKEILEHADIRKLYLGG
ncbi:MAG: ABC transporter ATP-binding protein [Deltaproteobacteria bacterium]|nr:ABC transporter ATP-binding protein [Deltaproteobacteria bacterium]MBW2153972.1 ABC transporter ATP-binding protein [Deltaproteobacteria bacterium]